MLGFGFKVHQDVTEVNDDTSIQELLVDFGLSGHLKDRRSIFEHIILNYDCIQISVNDVRPKTTILFFP